MTYKHSVNPATESPTHADGATGCRGPPSCRRPNGGMNTRCSGSYAATTATVQSFGTLIVTSSSEQPINWIGLVMVTIAGS